MAEEHIFDRYTKAKADFEIARKEAESLYLSWREKTDCLRFNGWQIKFEGSQGFILLEDRKKTEVIDLESVPSLEDLTRASQKFHAAADHLKALRGQMTPDQLKAVAN